MVTYPDSINDQLQTLVFSVLELLFFMILYFLKIMRYVRQDSVIIGPTSGCLRHVTTGLWDSETPPIYSMWCVQAINSQESNPLYNLQM